MLRLVVFGLALVVVAACGGSKETRAVESVLETRLMCADVEEVVITAEEGVTLHKGEELGYFQFGGSDFVMVFERASSVRLLGTPQSQIARSIDARREKLESEG